jgi:hypothetical protein
LNAVHLIKKKEMSVNLNKTLFALVLCALSLSATASDQTNCSAAGGAFLTGNVTSSPRYASGSYIQGVQTSHTHVNLTADQDGLSYDVAMDNVFAADYVQGSSSMPATLAAIKIGDRLELCGEKYTSGTGIHWVHNNCGAAPKTTAPNGWVKEIASNGSVGSNLEDSQSYCYLWGTSGGTPSCDSGVIDGSATTCTAAGLPNYTGTAYTHVYSTYSGGGACTQVAAPGYDTSGCTAPQGTVLSNGVAVTGIAVAAGANKMYTIVVPSGQTSLTFDTSGGTGDADLYVQLGSAPTTTSYLQKSDGSTATEHIAISNPAAGTYYVMVNGYAASSGISLVAKYSASVGNSLTNGVPVTGLAGSSGSSKVYTLVVPAGRPSVTFKTTGGTGDADLYVQVGSAPTTTSYLKSSAGSTTTETITITSPAAGTYYVMVYGYATYSGVSLTGSD